MNTPTNTPDMMTINSFPFPIHTGGLQPHWIETAKLKGFDIVARIIDRMHFAMRCRTCGGLNKIKLFTLMNAQPLCSHCIEAVWKADAHAAGLIFLHRDPADRHYAIYRSPCGHDVRRQLELIKRIAAGATGLRCDTCHEETEVAEAATRGWTLIGPDPENDQNYRYYSHAECGHEQRVARVNMQSGRFACGSCGEVWSAAPSWLYAMAFTLPTGREVVKLGYSRDPESRLSYQLLRNQDMPCELLTKVAVPTGQKALQIEKRLHALLRKVYPGCEVNPASYRDQIRVKSEIYDGRMTPIILGHLAEIEADLKQAA